jgi:hypothetical protein
MKASYNAYVIQRKSDKYYWHGIKNDRLDCWVADLTDAEICRRRPRLMEEMEANAIPILITIEERNARVVKRQTHRPQETASESS